MLVYPAEWNLAAAEPYRMFLRNEARITAQLRRFRDWLNQQAREAREWTEAQARGSGGA